MKMHPMLRFYLAPNVSGQTRTRWRAASAEIASVVSTPGGTPHMHEPGSQNGDRPGSQRANRPSAVSRSTCFFTSSEIGSA